MERIEEIVHTLKLSNLGTRLYLIALITHERTHSTQSYEFLKQHNVIADVTDERYQYQEHEYQADSAAYIAVLSYIRDHQTEFTDSERDYLSSYI